MKKKHKIEFSVSCTEAEHEKAWFIVQYRCGILRFWLLIFVISLSLIAAAYVLLAEREAERLLLAVGFCIGAMLLPIVYFIAVILHVNKRRRHYLEKYMSIGERNITVFSHSISVTSQMVSTDIPFADCKRFVEKKDFFLLIQGRRGYLIIPKRDVPPKETEELKKRLKRASSWYRLFHRG